MVSTCWTEKQMVRHTNRDRQTDTHTHTHTHRQMDGQEVVPDRQEALTDRHTGSAGRQTGSIGGKTGRPTGNGARQTGSTDQLVVSEAGAGDIIDEPPTSSANGSGANICYGGKHANPDYHGDPSLTLAALPCNSHQRGRGQNDFLSWFRGKWAERRS